MLQVGLSLLGNARDGGNWAGVGQDVQQMNRERMLRQRMDNEQRRQKTQDAREESVFGRQQTEWERADEQRLALEAWITTLPEEQQRAARANPAAAHAAFMEAQAAANAPITPYQRAQLDLAQRGQNMDYTASMARVNMDRPLRGPDASLMSSVREAAARSQALSALGDEFLAANARNATGELSPYNPANLVSPDRAQMRAASSRMRGYMRPPGSGATSDFEQRLYGQGAPSTANTGPQNQAIVAAHRTQAQLDQARMNFYEAWAYQNGNLYGAEQAFQQSDDFRRIRSDFERRPRGGGSSGAPPRPSGVPSSARWNPQTRQWEE
jgi:hypothetical protein